MTSPPLSPISQDPAEKPETTVEEPAVLQSEETNKSTNAETALGALKAFFTVKSAKKDTSNRMDLDTVKKKINRDKDVLKAFFDRSSSKSPDNKDTTDSKVWSEQMIAFDGSISVSIHVKNLILCAPIKCNHFSYFILIGSLIQHISMVQCTLIVVVFFVL